MKSKQQLSLFPVAVDGEPADPRPEALPIAAAASAEAEAGHYEGGEVETDLPDARSRAFATDPRNNVVLEASAGTGKTSVLVGRYMNLLRAGVNPVNVLAITFTRKAAAEMRERIIGELRAGAERSAEDRIVWRDLRDRLGDIAIGTIDAFCLSLLREFPLEADLDPGFTLADETEVPRLVEQALDRALRTSGALAREDEDVALVFAHLKTTQIRRGLAHLLERRHVAEQALRRFLASGPSDLTGDRACRRAADRIAQVLRGAPGGIERFLDEGPVEHPRFAMLAAEIRTLDDIAQRDPALARSVLERVRDHFITQDNKPRQRLSGYNKLHAPSEAAWKRHCAAVAVLAPQVAEALAALGRDLNVVLARGVRRMFAVAAAEYRRVLEREVVLDFAGVLDRALELLRQMDEFAQSRYRLESRYHHVLVDEFQDTSRAQWELVSLLVKSWGEGFGLVHDAPLEPSIFIVGDRKQSIYRFRDAEVSVLDEAALAVQALRPEGRARDWISWSFRAVPGLLAFANDLFADIEKADARADAFRYTELDRFPEAPRAVGERMDGAPVLGVAANDDPQACAASVADEIVRLIGTEMVRDRQTGVPRPAKPGDVAILFRTRDTHREYEAALDARGIPAYVYKGLGFFDADEIRDVCALMRFLANPQSNLHAAAFLRSRFVRLSDAALSHLAPALAAAVTAPDEPVALARCSGEDRDVLVRLRSAVPVWLSLVDRLPPAEVVDQVIADSAYLYEMRGPRLVQARENLKKMRGLVRRIQNRGYATLARIADYADRLSAGDESNAIIDAHDAVNLMTVHAAKGLEFPIVFVVSLTRGTGGPGQPIRVLADAGGGEPSVSIGAFRGEADDDERLRNREETKRLLYVAVTRARDRLYLGTVTRAGVAKPGPGSLAEVLPDSICQLLAEAATAGGAGMPLFWTGAGGHQHPFTVCPPLASQIEHRLRPPHDGVLSATPAAEVLDDFDSIEPPDAPIRMRATECVPAFSDSAGELAEDRCEPGDPLVGAVVHRLFQFAPAAAETMEQLHIRASGLLDAADADLDARDLSRLCERAVEIYEDLRARPDVTLALGSGTALFEVPFSVAIAAGQTLGPYRAAADMVMRGSIDWLVRKPDARITILELKTGRPRAQHRSQLDLYVHAARALFPSAVVDGLLLYA